MIKFFKNRVIKSNKGISIIFAIIIIVLMGLAGSVFAYLMASSGITSRQNLTSAEAKYAAKSGIEIAMYQLKSNSSSNFTNSAPADVSCPTTPVIPPGVTLSLSTSYRYIFGNLAPNYSIDNYTPSFCALVAQVNGNGNGNDTSCYIITANGQAGGTTREISAEVGIGASVSSCGGGANNTIFVENELPNSNN